MNGAELLCDILIANSIDVCFANPGTSEMHFVAALDHKPEIRCILGLSEGVVTGAADGYARMADKPAATLMHLGPGLANGLANLHNARRARTPIVNIVGDHASDYLKYDSPLTTDIESLARPMSQWVGRAMGASDIRRCFEEGLAASIARRGVSTIILPADASWGQVERETLSAIPVPPPRALNERVLARAEEALRSGRRTAIILSGKALRERTMATAGQIASLTGAALFAPIFPARIQRGAGRAVVRTTPYDPDQARNAFREFEIVICVGDPPPVAYFAYPGKPNSLLQDNCQVLQLADHEHDLAASIEALADKLSVKRQEDFRQEAFTQKNLMIPTGALTPDTISVAVARHLPENAIVINEAITSIGRHEELAAGLHPHDHLSIVGAAIGIGIPLATGAALAAPDRKVVALQADGSGMYTVQGLWTQAREKLDIVTIVFANNAYRILLGEMEKVGVKHVGKNARSMFSLDEPTIDWTKLAHSLGVDAGRADTIEQFTKLLTYATARKGPFLIEAIIS